MNLQVDLAPGSKRGLTLENPVMTASGTFSNGLEYASVFDIQRLGAIVSKGVTLQPRRGNPQTRTCETPAGMLNSIGLQNIGVSALIRQVAPVWATWDVPVVVNINGETVAENAELAARLEGVPGVSGIELNLGCPNVDVGGMEFGQDPELAAEVTRAVLRETTLPVIVKLTPNVTSVVDIARAVVDVGASALCLINTVLGMAVDVKARRPAISRGVAGLSGPAIRPIGVRMVYQVAAAVDVPIIGCGGIMTGEDALEYIMAGASAVQVGTATFANPRAPLDVLEGIQAFMEREGVEDLAEIVGAAQRRPAAAARSEYADSGV